MNDPVLTMVRGHGVLWFPLFPHIHIHCPISDVEAAQFGYTIQEFCCHVCAVGQVFYLDVTNPVAMLDDSEMADRLSEFKTQHHDCIPSTVAGLAYRHVLAEALQGDDEQTFCPEARAETEDFDFRECEHLDS